MSKSNQKHKELTVEYAKVWQAGDYTRGQVLGKECVEFSEQLSFMWAFDLAMLKPLCRGGCVYGGKFFEYPKSPEFRKRISLQEFKEFTTELQEKLYEGDPYCALFGLTLGRFCCPLSTLLCYNC